MEGCFGWIGFVKVGCEKDGFGKVGFGRLGLERSGLEMLGLAGWVWQVRLGFGLCSLEGGEGGVLGRSGLVAGGRPHSDRHKA